MHTLVSTVDCWRLSNSGAIDPAGFWEFGRGEHATTVSVWLYLWCYRTLVVCNNWSQHTWPRSSTSCLWLKFSSTMSDDKVYSPVSSFSPSLISWFVSSSCFIIESWIRSAQEYIARGQIVQTQTFDGKSRLTAFLTTIGLSRCSFWFVCAQWFLTCIDIGPNFWYKGWELGDGGYSIYQLNTRLGTTK